MKILFVNDSGGLRGGTETVIKATAKLMLADGHSLAMVCGDKASKTNAAFEGVRVYTVKDKWLSTQRQGGKEALEFRQIIAIEDPNVIHIHNVRNPSVMAEANRMKPTVRSIHDLTVVCVDNRAKVLRKSDTICEAPVSWQCIYKAFSEKCTTRHPLHLVSSFLKKTRELSVLKELCKIIVHSNYVKYCLVTNGIDGRRIETIPLFAPFPADAHKTSAVRILLFVGNINWTKGLPCLIQALSKIKSDFELIVAGEGPELVQMKSLGERILGSHRIRFLGFVENSELEKYYSMCNFVVIPSILPEAFSLVGLEAMMHAKAAVAFHVGGITEWLIHKETGFLVPRGDIITLANYIEKLLNNPELAENMGLAARQHAERSFTSLIYMNHLLKVYKETETLWKRRFGKLCE